MLDAFAGHSCWTLFARHSFLTLLQDTLSWHSCLTLSWHSCLTLFLDTFAWHTLLTLLLHTLAGHYCLTLLLDSLAWHSFLTLFLDTLAWRSCWTLLVDAFAGHSFLTPFARPSCWTVLTGHSCLTLLLDTLPGHSYRTLLPNSLAGHSFLTLVLDTLSWHSWQDTLVGHSCLTPFLDALLWHTCKDTVARHTCLTLLEDTLDRTPLLDTFAGHSCWTLLLDTLAGHSCLTLFLDTLAALFLDTLAWHSCWTLLTYLTGHFSYFDTPPGHSYRTLLLDTLAGHSCSTLFLDTLAGHSCQDTLGGHHETSFQNERFPRDFHQKGESKLPKRAFSTRLSSKVRIQASKTSIFHETFTKRENPSFQNEHFPRDFHQKWQAKLPKRAFSTRLSPKKRESKLPKRAFSTRLSPKVTIQACKTSVLHETSRKSELRSKHSASQIPMEQRSSTPLKHHSEAANPNGTATQTRHFHETLRLCSEISFFNLQVYHVLRLPRKMTFVTFLKTSKIVALPSAWNDFDPFHSHTLSSKSTFYLRLVKNGAFQATLQLQIPM